MQEHYSSLHSARPGSPGPGLLYGVYLAEVVSVDDPDSLNRVRVRLLGFDGPNDQDAPVWARVAVPFAGGRRGAFLIPSPGDEVAVQFVNGDPRQPLIMGSMWNGGQSAPETLSGNQVDRWSFVGRNGTRIAIVETSDSQETIHLSTPNDQNSVLVTADTGGRIELKTSMGTVKVESGGISIQSSAKVTVEAPQLELKASYVDVQACFTNVSGVVQCSTLIATTVCGSTYTPGAGNIW